MLEKTLVSVFEQLLGIEESDIFDNTNSNDQTVEGAINLMTKCGYVYEKNVMQSSDKGNRSDKDQEKLDSFNKIFNSLQNFSEAKNTKIT